METIEVKRIVNAPQEIVWNVISDVEGYANFASNLSKAQIMSGSETSMVRRCWDTKGQGWNEQCTLWDEGRAYSMTVDTTAPDYPYPIKSLNGYWAAEPAPNGTLITMRFEYELKFGIAGKALAKLMSRQSRKIAEDVLDNWQVEIERLAVV